MFAQAPKAWIAVTEMDILRDEGIAYGKKLQQAGVTVEIRVYEKVPHPTMALDGASITLCSLESETMFIELYV